MVSAPLPRISPEQYLELEEQSQVRHEYIDGQMYAMAGGTLAHAALCVAVAAELRSALRGRDCLVVDGNMQAKISATEYFYPDATVVCGPGHEPVLIVEVLSKSTEGFDRGAKFMRYKKFPALREYVLVSQTEMRVESFLRGDDGRWTISEFEGVEGICRLESLACEVPLTDLYAGIQLDAG